MWTDKNKMTEELSNLYDLYFDKFNCEPDWYDDIECSGMSYDKFVKYIKISLENNIELPEAMDYDIVIKKAINSYKKYGKLRIICPGCLGRMVKIREDDNSYTIKCKKYGCVSVNIKPPKQKELFLL